MNWIIVVIIFVLVFLTGKGEKNGKKIENRTFPGERERTRETGRESYGFSQASRTALRNRKEDILKRANRNNMMVNEAVTAGNTAKKEGERGKEMTSPTGLSVTEQRGARETLKKELSKEKARPTALDKKNRGRKACEVSGDGEKSLIENFRPEDRELPEEKATFDESLKDILGGYIFDGFGASDALYLAKKDVEEERYRITDGIGDKR